SSVTALDLPAHCFPCTISDHSRQSAAVAAWFKLDSDRQGNMEEASNGDWDTDGSWPEHDAAPRALVAHPRRAGGAAPGWFAAARPLAARARPAARAG